MASRCSRYFNLSFAAAVRTSAAGSGGLRAAFGAAKAAGGGSKELVLSPKDVLRRLVWDLLPAGGATAVIGGGLSREGGGSKPAAGRGKKVKRNVTEMELITEPLTNTLFLF